MHIKIPKVITMRFQSAHVGPEKQKKRLDVNDNSSWKTHFFFHRQDN
jgi:hypothetical protein